MKSGGVLVKVVLLLRFVLKGKKAQDVVRRELKQVLGTIMEGREQSHTGPDPKHEKQMAATSHEVHVSQPVLYWMFLYAGWPLIGLKLVSASKLW